MLRESSYINRPDGVLTGHAPATPSLLSPATQVVISRRPASWGSPSAGCDCLHAPVTCSTPTHGRLLDFPPCLSSSISPRCRPARPCDRRVLDSTPGCRAFDLDSRSSFRGADPRLASQTLGVHMRGRALTRALRSRRGRSGATLASVCFACASQPEHFAMPRTCTPTVLLTPSARARQDVRGDLDLNRCGLRPRLVPRSTSERSTG